jgi:transposase InsO family protein
VRLLCRSLGVSEQGYYASLKRPPSARALESQRLGDLVEVTFYENKRRYGVKRIQNVLQDEGIRCGKQRISRLMKERKLEAKGKKRFRVTTNSKHSHPVAENVLERNFSPLKPNQVWAGDITYLWTQEGWMYLAVFMDLYSRRVVGWATSKRLTTGFVLLAFERACARRSPSRSLMVHTDRGSQYASYLFRQMLQRGQHTLSMSRKGNCWDNAVVESFFARLKVEMFHGERFNSRRQLEHELFDYIERFYNQRRKHSFLEYLSPLMYEKIYNSESRAA